MMPSKHYKATCHCGAVELDVTFPEGLPKPIICNCSICKRKGAAMLPTAKKNVAIIKGADKLSMYQFNTMVAKHYFCSICGIYTHHQRRVNPNQYSINMGCIENL